ncbi:hypothetical protein IHE44_0013995 [Lamprotornis superbus]|uniref:Rho-related GTP-binding protein RhoV n=1 Tax=Lamprotornis superbus TaxID=245042 RepID=A0A835U011_9PASS|nr:hypothetical protein IHE44_0013995 [Lamprotornis superbus]
MPPQELLDYAPALRRHSPPRGSGPELGIKCVLVGDGAVGKTSLVVSYTTNGYPDEYQPTALDTFSVQVLVDGAPVRIQLWDTAGQEDFDCLRSLCYPDTDVFLVCFSVVNPSSFQNITEKWIPEIRTHNPRAPVLLVGTQADLRDDVNVLISLDRYHVKPVPRPQAEGLADKIRAEAYLECSALTQKNLKEVFDMAIVSGVEHKARQEKKMTAKGIKTLSKCRWKKFFCFSLLDLLKSKAKEIDEVYADRSGLLPIQMWGPRAAPESEGWKVGLLREECGGSAESKERKWTKRQCSRESSPGLPVPIV